MTEATRSGSCFCGAVRYRMALPPLWVAHCHCAMCRRAQGAAFVTWVGADESTFALESGTDAVATFQSSPPAVRSFCSRCGTPLFFQSTRWPGEVHVTMATLDSADGIEPQAHVHWGSRVPWAHLGDDGLPRKWE
jgi:hypothetical protein